MSPRWANPSGARTARRIPAASCSANQAPAFDFEPRDHLEIGELLDASDIILRRQLIEWLRPLGRLHVYVGPSPD
ncbi:hypothetical protein, partial [Agromyces humi]|uniref:hypothetical protein n=1 Tax=Agromyces humi TaxID=1766800 RepID=UPI00193A8919